MPLEGQEPLLTSKEDWRSCPGDREGVFLQGIEDRSSTPILKKKKKSPQENRGTLIDHG